MLVVGHVARECAISLMPDGGSSAMRSPAKPIARGLRCDFSV
jgi:hypothetical protein